MNRWQIHDNMPNEQYKAEFARLRATAAEYGSDAAMADWPDESLVRAFGRNSTNAFDAFAIETAIRVLADLNKITYDAFKGAYTGAF